MEGRGINAKKADQLLGLIGSKLPSGIGQLVRKDLRTRSAAA
jgi:hypothetical protein